MLNRLKKEIERENKAQVRKNIDFIKNGNVGDEDRGLRYFSTDTRFNAYKAGDLTRDKAIEYATKRMEKQKAAELEKEFARIDAAAAAADIVTLSVNIEWVRSSVWGYNPQVEVIASDKNGRYFRTYGSASGCGYDKQSAATAQAFGQLNGLLKGLYTLKNKALNKDPKATNEAAICYGAGYGVRPYFEGGVGFGCHEKMLKLIGLEKKNEAHGKHFDNYYFER